MAEPRSHRDERALAGLFLVLALLVAWQLARDETPDLPASLALPLQRPAASTGDTALADFVEILQRPVFSADRGRTAPATPAIVPPAGPGATAPAATATLEGWTLLGISTRGERIVALVRQGNDGAATVVRRGDLLGDWRVAGTLGTRALLLERDGMPAELSMAGHSGRTLSSAEQK